MLVFVTFYTVDLDEGLGRALGAVILASWLVGLTGYGYARLVSSERDERGALTLVAGFGNSGFVGFPLAQLAYGAEGLTLAVLYDRLSWLVPASSISTTIARLHGRREVDVRGGTECGRCWRIRRCMRSGSPSSSERPASTSRVPGRRRTSSAR